MSGAPTKLIIVIITILALHCSIHLTFFPVADTIIIVLVVVVQL